MDIGLSAKPSVFLVSGASRGLGRAIVEAALGAGHHVVVRRVLPDDGVEEQIVNLLDAGLASPLDGHLVLVGIGRRFRRDQIAKCRQLDLEPFVGLW